MSKITMQRQWMVCGMAALLASSGLGAQSLSIPASEARRGGSGTLLLVLESPAGKAPVALQWKFVLPAGVTADAGDMVAGSAAEAAQKSLTCSPARDPKAAQGTAYNCILAGGDRPLSNGPVAIVRYRALKAVSGKVAAEAISGATAEAKKIDIPDAKGVITIK